MDLELMSCRPVPSISLEGKLTGKSRAFVRATHENSVSDGVWNVSLRKVDVACRDFCEFQEFWVLCPWNVRFRVYVKMRRNVVSLECKDFVRKRMLWNEVEHLTYLQLVCYDHLKLYWLQTEP